MLATMIWFIGLDTIAKVLLTRAGLPLFQVVWARFFFHFAAATLLILVLWPTLITSQRPKLQFVRSTLLFATTAMFNAGLRTAPLATATTIMFLAPIILTVLSVFILGEQVGLRRWTGVMLGFVGALIVVRPGREGFSMGSIFFLLAAATNAVYQLVTRKLADFDDPRTSLFYTPLVGTLVSSCFVPFHWQQPLFVDWILLLSMGLIGGIGHLLLVYAFDRAPASVVAPFAYSQIIWAAVSGFVFFGEVPDKPTILGAALISGSGLYIFYRERAIASRRVLRS